MMESGRSASATRRGADVDLFRWGIVGNGHAAQKFCRTVRQLESMEISAIAGRALQNVREFAEGVGCTKSYSDVDELISGTDVDAIYVATPATHHRDASAKAVSARIPVLCEKPLCYCDLDTHSLIQLAQDGPSFLMEGVWNLFVPTVQSVASMAAGGMIGEVLNITSLFGKALEHTNSERLYQIDLGGGALFDLGIYPVAFALSVFDDAPKSTRLNAAMFKNGVDSTISATLMFSGGGIASIAASIENTLPGYAEIEGTDGSILIPNLLHPDLAVMTPLSGDPIEFSFPLSRTGMEFQILHFVDCVRAGRSESDIWPLSKSYAVANALTELRSQMPAALTQPTQLAG